VVTGTVISSTAFNALTADLATGLSTAITKDGQTTTTSRILFAQGISSTLTTDATSTTTGSIITAGGISCQKAAVVGTLLGVGMAPTNVVDITKNQNNLSTVSILNNDAGTAAQARFMATNGTSVGLFGTTGQNYTPAAIFSGGDTYVIAQGNNLDLVAAAAIKFAVNNTSAEIARIDTGGNLLINSTATGGPTTVSKLVVTNSNTNVAYLDDTDAGTSDSLIIRKASTAGTLARFYYTSTSVGTITTNGTTTTYGTSSDYRLKENVQPMTGGLDIIAALKPVTYDWIVDQTAGEGFIAHELQAVIPAAVVGEKDALNKDGNINPQNVDFGKIVPHLVAAMQELTTRLAALENK
jgi:hypothetical protein